jgi:hypothetical protein
MKNSILLTLSLIISLACSQSTYEKDTTKQETIIIEDFINPYNPLSKPNTYAKPDNPNY